MKLMIELNGLEGTAKWKNPKGLTKPETNDLSLTIQSQLHDYGLIELSKNVKTKITVED